MFLGEECNVMMTRSKTAFMALILWGSLTPIAASAQERMTLSKLARFHAVATEASLLRFNSVAQREANPNRDRFLQSPDDPLPQTLPSDDLIITPDNNSEPGGLSDTTPLTIESINVIGSTVFTDADLAPIP
jgi:hypothetical protein